MAEKKGPVQDVRNITLEEKLDKLIGLITLQNKANDNVLALLNAIHTLLIEKYKAQDMLLEQFPAVKGPPPTAESRVANREASPTVGGSRQPEPFNDYSDRVPYGTQLEEEARPTAQSFPVPPNARPPAPPEVSAQQIYRSSVGHEEVVGQNADSDARQQPPSTKAAILEQREKADEEDA